MPAAPQPHPDGGRFLQLCPEDCGDAPPEHHTPDTVVQEGFLAANDGHLEVPPLLTGCQTAEPLHHRYQSFAMDISLPSDFCVAEFPNLFQHLASSPDAHMKAMQEHVHLLHQLKQMLF